MITNLYFMYRFFFLFFLFVFSSVFTLAQTKHLSQKPPVVKKKDQGKVRYGVASYYADKFNGRRTANGEIYHSGKLTAACNVLPFNTWIRVTNLRNKRSVIVKINDRLHFKNKRLVDLSKAAARELGYIGHGLARVKIEIVSRETAEKK